MVAVALWLPAHVAAVGAGDAVAVALLSPAVLIAGAVAGRWGGRYAVWSPALLPPAGATVVLWATAGVDSAVAALVGLGVLLWCPWLVGRWLRARAALSRAGWQVAARWEDRARATEAEARRREQVRLASQLHDVVGHDLARAALTLGALELDATIPAHVQRAVGTARTRLTAAAEHLTDTVRALDDGGAGAPPDTVLTGLVESLRADGRDVTLVPADPSQALYDADDAVGALAVRVVREGLTNALKHGGDGPVEVSLARRDAELAVVVRSHGESGRAAVGGGRGLAALRRDVESLGGRFDRARTGDDHVLVVLLPLAPATAAAGPAGVDRARRSALSRVRRSRRVAVRGAAAAVAVSLLLVAGYRVVDVLTSVLPPGTFAALSVGTARADVERDLPARTRTDGTGIPAPPGTRCEHYSASAGLLSGDLYRLCWADGRLVRKDLITRPTTPGTIGT